LTHEEAALIIGRGRTFLISFNVTNCNGSTRNYFSGWVRDNAANATSGGLSSSRHRPQHDKQEGDQGES
jgi:hypothetical protein